MTNSIKLFDEKFVHFLWDDSLVGKEGFFSDCMTSLIIGVKGNNGVRGTVLEKSSEVTAEFVSINKANWKFFYYDPLYDYKWAYYKGRRVQYRDAIWRDVDCNWGWDDSYEYRVVIEGGKKYPLRLTYKQLAMWLIKGNGQAMTEKRMLLFCTISYESAQETWELPNGWVVRKWNDDEWHEPTMDYCFPESESGESEELDS